ncbi:hypothetical protein F4778DRAFT_717069 [Xylariomycetidae sp. FL2044]|nr:hypothetical protein F4778DRAFT_717069 [Xylariomycetidae sp. FL2044]
MEPSTSPAEPKPPVEDTRDESSPSGQRPRRVRVSKPKVKTGCNNCKQRRIKCDEKRPECSQCVRSKKTCPGYPPPLREKLDPPPLWVPKPAVSDSGYGSVLDTLRTSRSIFRPYPVSNAHAGEAEEADAATVYTDFSVVSDEPTGSYRYITTFADDLLKRLEARRLEPTVVEAVSSRLPALLKAFSLNIGYQATTQSHLDMMVFIHKNQDAIESCFKENYYQARNLNYGPTLDHEADEVISTNGLLPTEIIERWLDSTDEADLELYRNEGLTGNILGDPPDNPGDNDELNIPGLEEYRRIIATNSSYSWLLSRLRREIILSGTDRGAVTDMEDDIFWAISKTVAISRTVDVNHISRKHPPSGVQVDFRITWPLMEFLQQQEYDEPIADAIANVITLTGSHSHVQALTCRQYMAQMWPITGPQILELLQNMLKEGKETKKTLLVETPTKLRIDASMSAGTFVAKVSGLPDFVAEVGEQLAWLGAALRPSPFESGIALCTPRVSQPYSSMDKTKPTRCRINYEIEQTSVNPHDENGQCWRFLFANPVIARGFPILRREESDVGLEVPLDIMVALARARYIDVFKSKVFVKGFSTMLVPTRQSDSLITWHLLYNDDPQKRISYLNDGILGHADVDLAYLRHYRHVLGWCSKAVSLAGTIRASYSIGGSMLPNAYSGCALVKVEISAGQFVMGTAAFTLGNREKPVHISRFGYLTKLQWLSSKYVVFWDEADKRGWLVNGASALLHLLRASLEHCRRKFPSAWLLDPSALKDPIDPSQPDFALQVLTSEENRNLILYRDRAEVYDEETRDAQICSTVSRRQVRYYRLEDQVEHIYNILEKLIDHQADAERRSGVQVRTRPRRQLEGWDFRDLVRDGDPFIPRVTNLQSIGKGWVDFTRAIHAITLFGRGFGEMIQPQLAIGSPCTRWALLPQGKYYLAARVADLRDIMENEGDATSNPRLLCRNVLWHIKKETFDPCRCATSGKGEHSDPVQALFPLNFLRNLKKKPPLALEDQGAVIFGQNTSLHWHWRDTGDPVRGDPPVEEEEGEESPAPAATDSSPSKDSGLGSSLDSANSRSITDSTGPAASSTAADDASSGVDTPDTSSRIRQPPQGFSKRHLPDMILAISKKVRL